MKEKLSNSIYKFSSLILHPSSLLSARRRKASGAAFDLVGRTATVERALEPEGSILIGGELWRARERNGKNVECSAMVRVVGARGCLLEVARIECRNEV